MSFNSVKKYKGCPVKMGTVAPSDSLCTSTGKYKMSLKR